MSTVLASEPLMSSEQVWNLILITIPTILLAIVTIWTNDRLVKITLTALSLLSPKRRRHRKPAPVQVEVNVEVHGKHEAPEGEEHRGFTFNANRPEETWDTALENMTKGIIPEVWPERHHE